MKRYVLEAIATPAEANTYIIVPNISANTALHPP